MPFYTRRTAKQKEARLIYEPSIQAYSLKFSYDQSIIEFVKHIIPAHKRTTSGPPDWIWYFGEEYFDVIKTLFEGHREYKLTIVTKDEVEEMRRKQEECRNTWRPAEHSIGKELQKFRDILVSIPGILPLGSYEFTTPMKIIENWNKVEASRAYRRAAIALHPDRGGDAVKMAELNNTWALLKEGYYIK